VVRARVRHDRVVDLLRDGQHGTTVANHPIGRTAASKDGIGIFIAAVAAALSGAYTLYALAAAISVPFVFYLVRETKGRTLESMGQAARQAARADRRMVAMGLDFPTDPETLREIVADPAALAARLAELAARDLEQDPDTRAEYATALRVAGRLDEAALEAELTLAAADMSGDLRRIVRAMLLVGHARQWRGEWTQADTMFHRAEKLALYLDDDTLVAAAAHHSGRSFYDQGKHVEAALRFRLALEINQRIGNAKADTAREALAAAMAKL